MERLERRWPQLAEVDFLVLEVPRLPTAPGDGWSDDAVPLGGADRRRRGAARAGSWSTGGRSRSVPRAATSAPLLVHEVVVEQVAELLGLTPETVDPRYGQD